MGPQAQGLDASRRARLRVSRRLAPWVPPVAAPTVRSRLLPLSETQDTSCEVVAQSITGSRLTVDLADFHGLPFALSGFHTWRNLVVASMAIRSRPGTIIEVGANIGTETIGFADIAPSVIAVEPDPDNLQRLHALATESPRVSVVDAAVAASPGVSRFMPPPDFVRTGIGHLSDEGTLEVTLTTVDELAAGEGTVSAIFSDTEGHECGVLEGATETIRGHRPVLVVEADSSHLARAGRSIDDLRSLLTGLDYEIHHMVRWGLSSTLADGNWLALPAEAHAKSAYHRALVGSALAPPRLNPLLRGR